MQENRKELGENINPSYTERIVDNYSRLMNVDSFDVDYELQKLKEDFKSCNLKGREKAVYKKEKIQELKENLVFQKLGISHLLTDLFIEINKNPDFAYEDFLSELTDFAEEYRFTQEQIDFFNKGFSDYQKKHEAVEKYIAMYPDYSNLFQACFGKKPKGKIIVEKGPMTLFFRCFDIDDYVYIFSFYKTNGDENKISNDDVKKASCSGGCAIDEAKIPELSGVITAENVRANDPFYESVADMEKIENIDANNDSTFLIENIKDKIEIDFKGVGKYEIRILEKAKNAKKPSRIQIFDLNVSDSEPIEDLALVSEDVLEKFGIRTSIGYIKNYNLPDSKKNFRDSICRLIKDSHRKNKGSIFINGNIVVISADNEAEIKYKQDDVIMIPNEQTSHIVKNHEQQHQFNKLFHSLMIAIASPDLNKILSETKNKNGKVELEIDGKKVEIDIVENVLLKFIRKYREYTGIDNRAKDEILAYYKDGTSADNIFKILSENNLYNYKNQEFYAKRIKTISDEVMQINGIAKLNVSRKKIEEYIEKVFGEYYITDLKKWTNTIKVLEEKGYFTIDVVSMLYQEPINSWPNLVRRL